MEIFRKFILGQNANTFRPLRSPPASVSPRLPSLLQTLGSGDLQQAVKLPEGEVECEWLAVHVVDFYNQLSVLFGTLADFCTPETCPRMTAGNRFEYFWGEEAVSPRGEADRSPREIVPPKPKKKKKSVQSLPARDYIDALMRWVEGLLEDERVFPMSKADPFPKDFRRITRSIFRRLFRVYAHIYYHHFPQVLELKEESHLNTSFKHYVYFVEYWKLVTPREMAPLQDLIDTLLRRPKTKKKDRSPRRILEKAKKVSPDPRPRSSSRSASPSPRSPDALESKNRTVSSPIISTTSGDGLVVIHDSRARKSFVV